MVENIVLRDRNLRFPLRDSGIYGGNLLSQIFCFGGNLSVPEIDFFRFGLNIRKSLLGVVILGARDGDFFILCLQVFLRLIERPQPQRDFQSALFFGILQKFFRLLRLLPERLDTFLQLRDDIAESQKVLLCVFQLAFRVQLAVTVAEIPAASSNISRLSSLLEDTMLSILPCPIME